MGAKPYNVDWCFVQTPDENRLLVDCPLCGQQLVKEMPVDAPAPWLNREKLTDVAEQELVRHLVIRCEKRGDPIAIELGEMYLMPDGNVLYASMAPLELTVMDREIMQAELANAEEWVKKTKWLLKGMQKCKAAAEVAVERP